MLELGGRARAEQAEAPRQVEGPLLADGSRPALRGRAVYRIHDILSDLFRNHSIPPNLVRNTLRDLQDGTRLLDDHHTGLSPGASTMDAEQRKLTATFGAIRAFVQQKQGARRPTVDEESMPGRRNESRPTANRRERTMRATVMYEAGD